jgi:hypothetical protein
MGLSRGGAGVRGEVGARWFILPENCAVGMVARQRIFARDKSPKPVIFHRFPDHSMNCDVSMLNDDPCRPLTAAARARRAAPAA